MKFNGLKTEIDLGQTGFLNNGGDMGERIRAFDWSGTALGDIAGWPQSLKTAVNIVLQSPVPMVMLWGRDGVMIYNDAYSVFAGGRHPLLLGSRVIEGWPEVADFNRNVMDKGLRGETLSYKSERLTLYRNNVPEEVWMDLNYSPIMDESGKPSGVLAIVLETTRQVIAEQARTESETRFRTLADQAPMIVYLVEPNAAANMSYFNKYWLDYTGLTFEEALGRTWDGIVHPDDFETVMNNYVPAFHARQPYTLETRLKRHDGEYRWFLFKGTPRYLNGEFVGFVGLGLDNHERKEAEEALKQSNERFQLINRATQDAIWDWNLLTDEVIWNEAVCNVFGYKPEEIEQTADWWVQRIHPEDLKRVTNGIHEVIDAGGVSWVDEYRYQCADGSYKTVYDRGFILHDEAGKSIRMLGSMQDMTARKKVETALKHSEIRLKKYTHQQDVIAEFSLQAITGVDNLAEITKIAVKMVAETLGTGYSKIIQRVPGTKNTLRILAVQGFPQDLVGKVFDPGAEPHSGYTLEALEPVVVDDLREEKRFTLSPILLANGMISGVAVVIYAGGKPFGVLEVDSRKKRHFTDAEVNFLQTAATLIGTVVERKHGEAALAQQHELMRTITDTASACLFMIDQDGLVTFLNPAAMEVTGYWPEDVIGKSMHMLVHHSHPDSTPYPEADCPLVETYRDGKPNPSHEDFFFRKDGSMFPALITGTPIQSIDGLTLGTVVEFRDITIEKRSQRLIENYTELLEASNRDLSQFASIVSHDLQAPLRKVMLFSDIISQQEADRLSEDGKNHIRRMQGSVIRMQALIRDLLSLSRIDRGGSAFKKTDLNQVVAKVLDDLAPSVKERGAQINIGDLGLLEADEQQMGQLFSNLIENALKYRREGIAPHIEISCEKLDAEFVQLTIADNGIGISPDHFGKIFEIFQRLHNESKYSGTGIGLAIVKRIVDRHKGVISVESIPGEGARFIIKLPVKQ